MWRGGESMLRQSSALRDCSDNTDSTRRDAQSNADEPVARYKKQQGTLHNARQRRGQAGNIFMLLQLLLPQEACLGALQEIPSPGEARTGVYVAGTSTKLGSSDSSTIIYYFTTILYFDTLLQYYF